MADPGTLPSPLPSSNGDIALTVRRVLAWLILAGAMTSLVFSVLLGLYQHSLYRLVEARIRRGVPDAIETGNAWRLPWSPPLYPPKSFVELVFFQPTNLLALILFGVSVAVLPPGSRDPEPEQAPQPDAHKGGVDSEV